MQVIEGKVTHEEETLDREGIDHVVKLIERFNRQLDIGRFPVIGTIQTHRPGAWCDYPDRDVVVTKGGVQVGCLWLTWREVEAALTILRPDGRPCIGVTGGNETLFRGHWADADTSAPVGGV